MKLGRANVDALLRSLTAKQFLEWQAYAQLEPFGEFRADYRAASIVQMIANVNRGAKQKAYTLQDFLLRFEVTEVKPAVAPWQRMKSMAQMIVAAYSTPNSADIQG